MTHSSNNSSLSDDRDKAGEFVWEHTMHSRYIYAYLRTLVPNSEDADDVFQEVGITLWEKFDEFKRGTNFRAWACQIAYFKVLEHRRKTNHLPVLLSPVACQRLAETMNQRIGKTEKEFQALQGCLEKLREKDRELITSRYQPEGSPKQLASTKNVPVKRIYKSLSRIRNALHECIKRTLAEEPSV
ncbi:hypothetical protein MNBD_PLANCTO02-1727 [hydrothermal vent metagenome]|uniref:RNA polymerase sigma-70 region 2 domain-containing protein n=1 Tax=hydrothermal vent metagenome TaxID=652676 RepID=A0A3B1DFG0_9ZZZZ